MLQIPSRELTYPLPRHFENDVPSPKVGYVSFLEGTIAENPHKIFCLSAVSLSTGLLIADVEAGMIYGKQCCCELTCADV